MSVPSITFACERCRRPLAAPANAAGGLTTCVHCGAAVRVPRGGSTPGGTIPVPPHLVPKAPVAPPAHSLPPPPPPAAPPLPPHLAGKSPAELRAVAPPIATPPAPPQEDAESEEESPQPTSPWLMGCLFVSVVLLVGVGGAALVSFTLHALNSASREKVARKESVGQLVEEIDPTGVWQDAETKSIVLSGASVGVVWVEFGAVDYKTAGGKVETTPDSKYLTINLKIKNRHRTSLNYKSWYVYEFRDSATFHNLELTDDRGVKFELAQFPEAERVERHGTAEATLAADEEMFDSLVFAVPEGYEPRPKREYRLLLPVAALGSKTAESFRFRIPPSMVRIKEAVPSTLLIPVDRIPETEE